MMQETGAGNYLAYLENSELSADTVRKYRNAFNGFIKFLAGREATEKLSEEYLRRLMKTYTPGSVNTAVSSLNRYYEFTGTNIRLCQFNFTVKVPEPLTYEEYLRLLKTARTLDNERLALIMEVICSAGLRISELLLVTVENVSAGKIRRSDYRTIIFPKNIREKLLAYAKDNGIRSGIIFITRLGKPPNRKVIWREMQILCDDAGVEAERATPECIKRLYAAQMEARMTVLAENWEGPQPVLSAKAETA